MKITLEQVQQWASVHLGENTVVSPGELYIAEQAYAAGAASRGVESELRYICGLNAEITKVNIELRIQLAEAQERLSAQLALHAKESNEMHSRISELNDDLVGHRTLRNSLESQLAALQGADSELDELLRLHSKRVTERDSLQSQLNEAQDALLVQRGMARLHRGERDALQKKLTELQKQVPIGEAVELYDGGDEEGPSALIALYRTIELGTKVYGEPIVVEPSKCIKCDGTGEVKTCCGNFTTGAEYMGRTETVCCGNPDVDSCPDCATNITGTLREALDKSGLCAYENDGDLAFLWSCHKFAELVKGK